MTTAIARLQFMAAAAVRREAIVWWVDCAGGYALARGGITARVQGSPHQIHDALRQLSRSGRLVASGGGPSVRWHTPRHAAAANAARLERAKALRRAKLDSHAERRKLRRALIVGAMQDPEPVHVITAADQWTAPPVWESVPASVWRYAELGSTEAAAC